MADEMKIIVPCDDDHFATSEIHLRTGTHIKGIIIELFPQFGEENYAFLHLNEIDEMINALTKLKTHLETEKF